METAVAGRTVMVRLLSIETLLSGESQLLHVSPISAKPRVTFVYYAADSSQIIRVSHVLSVSIGVAPPPPHFPSGENELARCGVVGF